MTRQHLTSWLSHRLTAAPPWWAIVTAIAVSQDHPYRKQLLLKQHYNASLPGDLINNVNIIKYAPRPPSDGETSHGAINPTPLCQVSLQQVLNHTNREPGEEMKCISATAAENDNQPVQRCLWWSSISMSWEKETESKRERDPLLYRESTNVGQSAASLEVS